MINLKTRTNVEEISARFSDSNHHQRNKWTRTAYRTYMKQMPASLFTYSIVNTTSSYLYMYSHHDINTGWGGKKPSQKVQYKRVKVEQKWPMRL